MMIRSHLAIPLGYDGHLGPVRGLEEISDRFHAGYKRRLTSMCKFAVSSKIDMANAGTLH